jgi:anti-sigma factor RsiW
MIECSNGEIRDQLPDFIHGRLRASDREAVAAHVTICVACTREVALLRELRGALAVAPAVDLARIVAALPRPRAVGRAAPRFRVEWRIAAAVAAVAVGVASLTLRGPTSREPSPEPSQRVAAREVAVDPELAEASAGELDALLRDLESFDGLPAPEPEPAVRAPDTTDATR